MRKYNVVPIAASLTILFFTTVGLSAPYQQKDQRKDLICPGLGLVLSCGNGKCEASLGENKLNCAADCVAAPVRSYNQQTLCEKVSKVYTPSNIQEVQGIILEARAKGTKVRMVGASHSANSLLCTDGVAISTEKLKKVIGIESVNNQETVNVEAGVTLWELSEWLHAHDRSLGFSIMGYRVGTIAGLVATGSHGSSPKHTAVISNLVESLTVVDAQGRISEISQGKVTEDVWKAYKTNLGMLGAVVQLKLRIQPQFNLRVKISYHDDSILFQKNGALNLVSQCDYGQLNWFPGVEKVMRTCGKRSSHAADPGASNVLLNPDLPAIIVKPLKMALQEGACATNSMCLIEKLRYGQYLLAPPFIKNNKLGFPYNSKNVVGPSHRMMSSVLTEHQHGFFQMDWEIVVPQQNIDEALLRIRDLNKKNKTCLPLVGVFIRFAPSEERTLLAHSVSEGAFHAGQTAAFIEMPVYIPTGFPADLKKKYEAPFEEFARTLVSEFNGRAHWGKNKEWLFELGTKLKIYGSRLERFQAVKSEVDPQGMFSNEFTQIMGLH